MSTTDEDLDTTTGAGTDTFSPPYISFAQFENVLERMRNEGVPARIDRSYLSSWSGSAQAQFLKATASLGLRDEHGRPTELLKQLVAQPEERPALIGALLNEKYPAVIALGDDATQQQLEEEFRKFDGIGGSTVRKAITFYLHAAKFAGIKTSPFFKAGRSTSSGSSPRSTSRVRAKPAPAPVGSNGGGGGPSGISAGMHPAIQTMVQALPKFDSGPLDKPEFSTPEREAWFAYARATFNLIYALPDGDTGGDA